MGASVITTPSSQAVHRLGTALCGALLVGIPIWASITIVGRICADGIESAAPVLVIIAVMVTVTIGTPVSITVHRLAATLTLALNKSILMWALFSIQVSLDVHHVRSAALVLVAISNMGAASIGAPLALAVHRLSTAALRALLELVIIWTSIPIVQSNLAHAIDTATLVLVICFIIVASVIHTPRSNTVHRLGTLLSGALLKLVGIWASISVVGGLDRDLVQSAALVLMNLLVMEASIILVPGSDTVHRLDAKLGAALNIGVSIWTGIAIV